MIYSRRRPSRQAGFYQRGFGDPGWSGTSKKNTMDVVGEGVTETKRGG